MTIVKTGLSGKTYIIAGLCYGIHLIPGGHGFFQVCLHLYSKTASMCTVKPGATSGGHIFPGIKLILTILVTQGHLCQISFKSVHFNNTKKNLWKWANIVGFDRDIYNLFVLMVSIPVNNISVMLVIFPVFLGWTRPQDFHNKVNLVSSFERTF